MNRTERLELRRERKFDKHAISVELEHTTEERKGQPVNFTHAVYAGKRIVARATSRRHALKAAHNYIRGRA